MQQAVQASPAEDFPNVVRLEKLAGKTPVQVDTPDTAPPADAAEQGLAETNAQPPPPSAPPEGPPTAPGTATSPH